MQKIIKVSIIILCILIAIVNQAQKKPLILENHISNQQDIEKTKFEIENCVSKDSSKTMFNRIVHEFKEERKNNRRNLKNASKYYNPITWIYKIFNL